MARILFDLDLLFNFFVIRAKRNVVHEIKIKATKVANEIEIHKIYVCMAQEYCKNNLISI